ncbi:putative reverse transcriptase domain-containing protein, partial [Tanacetum coccineum]
MCQVSKGTATNAGLYMPLRTAFQSRVDINMDVVNRSLGNLLRCLVGDHVKAWDQKLCQAEFAYNHAVIRSTRFSPFQVVYSAQPRGPLDLMTPYVSSFVPGTGYSLKDKNEAKPGKTEHEFGKSAKNQGQGYKRIENGAKTEIPRSTRQ